MNGTNQMGSFAVTGTGEIIGDLAQSALTARAVEPAHGEAGEGHSHESACLNCGTALLGRHCHQCGQAAHVHKTLGAFFHDFLHGVFHFEGKIWRTLPALALRPGQMTREYIDGRRASYVSPIALFLFAVFLTFAVVKNAQIVPVSVVNIDVNGKDIKGLEANKAEVARLEKQRDALKAQGKPVDAIEGEIEGRRSGIESTEAIRDPAKTVLDDAAKDGKPIAQSNIPAIDAMLEQTRKNPQLAIYKLQSNAYKFAWALIPISVPFMWLLFPFSRRFGLYDHIVFVTYSLCFMLLLVSLLTLLRWLGLPVMVAGMILLPPLHIYKQVKYSYGLTRWGAAWRTLALCIYAFLALLMFLLLLIVMG